MANETERRLILEMIESGKITAEDGLNLLQALPTDPTEEFAGDVPESWSLEAGHPAETSLGEDQPSESTPLPAAPQADMLAASVASPAGEAEGFAGEATVQSVAPDFDRWRQFWIIPLWVGVGITILGAWLMYAAQQSSGLGFWFLCAWIPFAIGLLLIVLAWGSRTARWLHLRVQQQPGEWPQNIAISFPLPLRATGWFMRTFQKRIPGLEDTSVDELLTAVENSTSADNPLYIEVEEGENGERVQIFIG